MTGKVTHAGVLQFDGEEVKKGRGGERGGRIKCVLLLVRGEKGEGKERKGGSSNFFFPQKIGQSLSSSLDDGGLRGRRRRLVRERREKDKPKRRLSIVFFLN